MNINMLLSTNKKMSTTLSVGRAGSMQYGFKRNQAGGLNPDIPTIIEFYVQNIGNGVLVVELSNPSPTGKIIFQINNNRFSFDSVSTTFSREAQSPEEKAFTSTIRNSLGKQLPLDIIY